jgi:predicted SnoaL-like aldol condensation-catalyzing enzyme
MAKLEELPIPNVVFKSDQKAEMVRIWIADGDQVVTISPRLWDDPGAWGLMLVDLARHIAKAYEVKGLDQLSALESIRSAMEAEWSSPTGNCDKEPGSN